MKTAPSDAKLILRPAFLGEEAAIIALMREAIARQSPAAYGADAIARWLAPGNDAFVFRVPTHCYVALRDGVIIGVSGWVDEEEEDLARITACYVAPKAMGQGLGAVLLAHAVREARCEGKARIYLRATENAAPFYAKYGFTTRGKHRFPITADEMLEGPEMWLEDALPDISSTSLTIRSAQDDDAPGLISLIDGCFQEYDGVFLDLENDDAILKGMRSGFRANGGHAWVLERSRQIVGCIGWTPGTDAVELKKLYLNKDLRGQGLAETLTRLVIDAAKRRRAGRVELWSDVKFTRGHGFYRKMGFTPTGDSRALEDISNTREYRFVLNLD